MGFYDTVLEDVKKVPELVVSMRKATVIRVQNVMNYYAMDIDEQDGFRKQLGVLTPPFEQCWIEADPPKRYRAVGWEIDWPPIGFVHAGALLETNRNVDGGFHIRYINFFDLSRVVISFPGMKFPHIIGEFDLRPDGTVTDHEKSASTLPLDGMDDQLKTVVYWNHQIYFDVITLSLSFLNCKNVDLDTTTPTVERTKDEVRHNVWPKPEHEFKTIHIRPFKAKKPSKPGSGEPMFHQRSHIVRGGFHTYAAEAPLFGNPKLVGQFWIPQHVRGKASEDITADYEIDV